jgi:hypothetical protein
LVKIWGSIGGINGVFQKKGEESPSAALRCHLPPQAGARRPATPRLCPTLQNPLLAFLQRKEYISYGVFMSYDKQERMSALEESDEVFNAKMQKGLDDARNGRVTPLDDAFAELKQRFA